jgi:hypothetical protein
MSPNCSSLFYRRDGLAAVVGYNRPFLDIRDALFLNRGPTPEASLAHSGDQEHKFFKNQDGASTDGKDF